MLLSVVCYDYYINLIFNNNKNLFGQRQNIKEIKDKNKQPTHTTMK